MICFLYECSIDRIDALVSCNFKIALSQTPDDFSYSFHYQENRFFRTKHATSCKCSSIWFNSKCLCNAKYANENNQFMLATVNETSHIFFFFALSFLRFFLFTNNINRVLCKTTNFKLCFLAKIHHCNVFHSCLAMARSSAINTIGFLAKKA